MTCVCVLSARRQAGLLFHMQQQRLIEMILPQGHNLCVWGFTKVLLQVGHAAWVAWTREEYLRIACALASDASMCAPIRCRAKLEQISQSRLDSGLSLSFWGAWGFSKTNVLGTMPGLMGWGFREITNNASAVAPGQYHLCPRI